MANIIITGASQGIGFELALEFAVLGGHSILAISRSAEGLDRLYKIAHQLNPDVNIKTLSMDLARENFEDSLKPVLESFFDHTIHILINNAGQLIHKPFMETKPEDFQKLMNINFISPIRLIQCLWPYFKGEWGHIVNIGSMGGFQGSVKFSGLSAYSASKGALHTLTECLGEEFKGSSIRINALALGSVQTEMVEEAFPDYKAPVLAYEMGAYIAQFALTGHTFFNGKIIPVAMSTP